MATSTLNVSLPEELARFIRERVASGMYTSASEVVREALRLFARSANGTGTSDPPRDEAHIRAAIGES